MQKNTKKDKERRKSVYPYLLDKLLFYGRISIIIREETKNYKKELKMAKRTYQDEIDRKNMDKLKNLLIELPDYVGDYFIARRTNTTTRTRLSYAYDIKNFYIYLLSEQYFSSCPSNVKDISTDDISALKARDIEQYMDYLQSDPEHNVGKRAAARKLAAISSLFQYLYLNERIPENVCEKVIKVKQDKDYRIIRLRSNEAERLLNAIEFGCDSFTPHQAKYLENTRIRDLAIVTTLITTGIRVSEIVGLSITDLNLEACTISIRAKGSKFRTIPLGDEAVEALTRYMQEREKITPVDDNSNDALFLSTQKKRMSVAAVENMVTKYAKAIGVRDRITPHKLRATCGSELYNTTGDINLVAALLGHENINTTRKHYVDLDQDRLFAMRNAVKVRSNKDQTEPSE